MGCSVKFAVHILFIIFFSKAALAEHSLQVYAGVNNINYDLNSEQFGATQTSKPSPIYSLLYENQTDLGDELTRVSLDHLTQSLSPFSTLTPSSINYNLTRFQVAQFNMHSFNWLKSPIMLGWGYSFINTKADATTPNVLMVNSDMHALDLLMEYSIFHQNDYELKLSFNLGLPFYKKEYGVVTGSNANSYYASAGYNLKKQLSENWSVLQTGEYFVQKNSYMGSGNRGTLNANETLQIYNLLVGVGYEF